MNKYFPLLLFLLPWSIYSQFSWNAEFNANGLAASEEEELPFWLVHNQRGRISEKTRSAGWISGKSSYSFDNDSFLQVGVGFLGQNGNRNEIFIDELYARYSTNYWSLTAGRKQQEELFDGLSSANRSILFSLNARPLPGFQLETTQPIFLLPNLGFEAAWEEYFFESNRFVRNARLHHKSFRFVFSSNNRDFVFKAGMHHFVQWGGNSPVHGDQPQSIKDYLRVISGQEGQVGATGSDQLNALGNHLGGYEFSLFKNFPHFKVEAFYQHLFEDGSGRRLGNTPDGRYGLFLDLKQPKSWLHSVMYEFYTTHHQSHTTTGPHKNDDYFNNSGYRSGWTYYGKILGSPFFTIDSDGSGISNNKFTMHHLGLGGLVTASSLSFPYKVLLSYGKNNGRRHIRIAPKQEVFYGLYEISLLQRDYELKLSLAAEYDSYKSPIYGAGLHVIYQL